jgi:cystathionine beta-synthase
LGADVVMTRSDVGKGHPEYYQDLAERLARSAPNAFYVNQFNNPANPLAHQTKTGPEIWAQMDGRLDAVVCGVGSGGTVTGLSRYFAQVAPQLEMVLADPVGSVLADYVATGRIGEAGSWAVEGIGEDFIPPICDLSRVRRAFSIPDQESFETARNLLRGEGILAGSSSGTLVAAALRYCREQTVPKRVVTLVCDTGSKYLSKMFNDYWMVDQGFVQRERHGDLRDLIARRHAEGAVASVGPADTLLRAYGKMKLYDVSQLPVLENERVVGIVDESDVLLAVLGDPERFHQSVGEYMTRELRTVSVSTPVEELMAVFRDGMVAIVYDGGQFCGLITRIDLLNGLRQRLR